MAIWGGKRGFSGGGRRFDSGGERFGERGRKRESESVGGNGGVGGAPTNRSRCKPSRTALHRHL